MNRAALIETMARAILDEGLWPGAWEKANGIERGDARWKATAALAAIEAMAVVVPREATAEQMLAVSDALAELAVWNVANKTRAEIRKEQGRQIIYAMLAASPFAKEASDGE